MTSPALIFHPAGILRAPAIGFWPVPGSVCIVLRQEVIEDRDRNDITLFIGACVIRARRGIGSTRHALPRLLHFAPAATLRAETPSEASSSPLRSLGSKGTTLGCCICDWRRGGQKYLGGPQIRRLMLLNIARQIHGLGDAIG